MYRTKQIMHKRILIYPVFQFLKIANQYIYHTLYTSLIPTTGTYHRATHLGQGTNITPPMAPSHSWHPHTHSLALSYSLLGTLTLQLTPFTPDVPGSACDTTSSRDCGGPGYWGRTPPPPPPLPPLILVPGRVWV